MSFRVRYTAAAREDIKRLYAFRLEHCETVEDLDAAADALAAVEASIEGLKRFPFIHRKAGSDPFLRELLIPFGHTGYVALFEIEDGSTVTILAVRHQREDDYH